MMQALCHCKLLNVKDHAAQRNLRMIVDVRRQAKGKTAEQRSGSRLMSRPLALK